jgi:hypothetical protein
VVSLQSDFHKSPQLFDLVPSMFPFITTNHVSFYSQPTLDYYMALGLRQQCRLLRTHVTGPELRAAEELRSVQGRR